MSIEYEKILKARSLERLIGSELLEFLIDDFEELHGDRLFGDDPAIVGGIGSINGQPVTIIAQDKGKELKDRQHKNYGMPHPEGYRKVQRLVKQAEKFKRPVITIVDTPGAYPGIGAEERGQGEAIASCILTFTDLKVPVITILLSEGGSGGALGMAVCDYFYMFENAYYSVISPEGFASILLKDEKMAPNIVGKMKIQSENLLEFKIVDEIVCEPVEGVNVTNIETFFGTFKQNISDKISELNNNDIDRLVEKRSKKLDSYGRI